MYQNRALNAAERLKEKKQPKPLPHVKNRVTKRLSAFLASFFVAVSLYLPCCQIRAQSSLINLRLSCWYFFTTNAHENARREPLSMSSAMPTTGGLQAKNPPELMKARPGRANGQIIFV
ncbi:hypothetical protein [Escherichia coli]|uniref:hypothetical protein n=1 Tax=Escherichia coli TaxID=562 RepID=UPI001FCE67C4|nr:hypothetical protein [Escherichia coli]